MPGLVLKIGADVEAAIAAINKFKNAVKGPVGSIEQLRSAIKLLEFELTQLNRTELNSPFGRGLSKTLATVKKDLISLEKQAGLSGAAAGNAFQRGFGGLRQLANILPGIGISGLFLVAAKGIEAMVKAITDSGTAARASGKNMKEYADAVQKATESSSAEILTLETLVSIARNENLSRQQRNNAIAQLQKQYPAYLKNITLETINSNAAKKAIDALTESIFKKALADALAKEFADKQLALFKEQVRVGKLLQIVGSQPGPFGKIAGFEARQGLANIEKLKKDAEDLRKLFKETFTETLDFVPPPKAVNVPPVKVDKLEIIPSIVTISQGFEVPVGEVEKIQKVINEAFKNTGNINAFGLSDKANLFGGLKPGSFINQEALDNLREYTREMNNLAEVITKKISNGFQQVFDDIQRGQTVFQALGNILKKVIFDLIKAKLEAIIFSLVLNLITGGAAGAARGLLGGISGGDPGNPSPGGGIAGLSGSALRGVNIAVTGSIRGNDILLSGARQQRANRANG